MSEPDWLQKFPTLSICRLDLINAGCDREYVGTLTDEQMQQIATAIASYIEDYAFEEGEWDETVRFIVQALRPSLDNPTILPPLL